MNRLMNWIFLTVFTVMTAAPAAAEDTGKDGAKDSLISISISDNDTETRAELDKARAEVVRAIKNLIITAIEKEGELDERELDAAKRDIRDAVEDLKSETGSDMSEAEIENEIEKGIEQELEKEIESTIEEVFSGEDDHESIHIDHDRIGKIEAVLGILLGGLFITLVFGTPLFIVGFVLYASYRKRQLVYNTMDRMIAEGKEIPPEILQDIRKETTPKSNLQKGLIWSCVGLGIIAAFAAMGNMTVAFLGLIPLFLGLAQLLIWKLDTGGSDKQV